MGIAAVFFHGMCVFGFWYCDQNKTKTKRKLRSVSVPVRFSAWNSDQRMLDWNGFILVSESYPKGGKK